MKTYNIEVSITEKHAVMRLNDVNESFGLQMVKHFIGQHGIETPNYIRFPVDSEDESFELGNGDWLTISYF